MFAAEDYKCLSCADVDKIYVYFVMAPFKIHFTTHLPIDTAPMADLMYWLFISDFKPLNDMQRCRCPGRDMQVDLHMAKVPLYPSHSSSVTLISYNNCVV